VDLQSQATFFYPSLSSHFKICTQSVEEGVAVRITGEAHLPVVVAERGIG